MTHVSLLPLFGHQGSVDSGFEVGLTQFMTLKGRGVISDRRDLLHDPKGHGDLGGRFDLVYDPKRSRVYVSSP